MTLKMAYKALLFIVNSLGTAIIANYYSAHRDPKYFVNPDQFDPERFLLPSGDLNMSLAERVIPYGLGARRCGGEVISRLQIFIFIATLVQKCEIVEVAEHLLDLDNYETTVALDPRPFKIVMKSRMNEW